MVTEEWRMKDGGWLNGEIKDPGQTQGGSLLNSLSGEVGGYLERTVYFMKRATNLEKLGIKGRNGKKV